MHNVNAGDFGTQDDITLSVEGKVYFDDIAMFDSYGHFSNGLYVGDTNEDETPFLFVLSSSTGGEGYIYVSGDISGETVTERSDKALKKDIKPIENGIDFILNLEPVQFKFKNGNSGRKHYGFIAQDVKKTIEKVGIGDAAIYVDPAVKPKESKPSSVPLSKELRYSQFIAPMVQTIQHLEQRIKDLEKRLDASV